MDKYHGDIDMQGNKVKNLVIEKSDTFPVTPSDGQIYIKSGILYWWDADISEWVSTPGAGVYQGGFNAGTETSMPAASQSDWWYITHGGNIGGILSEDVKPGDIIVANTDTPGNDEGNWTVVRIEREADSLWQVYDANTITPAEGKDIIATDITALAIVSAQANLGNDLIEVTDPSTVYVRPAETETVVQLLGVIPATHGSHPLKLARVKKALLEELTLSTSLKLSYLAGFAESKRMVVIDNNGVINTDVIESDGVVGRGTVIVDGEGETGAISVTLTLLSPNAICTYEGGNVTVNLPGHIGTRNAEMTVRKSSASAYAVTIANNEGVHYNHEAGDVLTSTTPGSWVRLKAVAVQAGDPPFHTIEIRWIVLEEGGSWLLDS